MAWCLRVAVLLLVWSSFTLVWSQGPSSQGPAGVKVCVAVVTNRTSQSLFVERMTERIVQNLNGGKTSAVAMESDTTSDRELHPTMRNSLEIKDKDCDFLVLTQVSDSRDHPTELRTPQILIGGKAPSVDASDPSDVPSRDYLDVRFALFRRGSVKPALDTSISAQPSSTISDSLMPAMDREANRVSREIKKK